MDKNTIPGNTMYAAYGGDGKKMTRELLLRADPFKGLDRSIRIGIKPNLVVPKPASSGATTHPEIAEAVLEILKDSGFTDIAIMESSWVGADTEAAFDKCGFRELSRRFGTDLVDLKHDEVSCRKIGSGEMYICRSVEEIDFFINLPVLKGHCQTLLTCALKNLKGCIPDSEKRRYHVLGLHRPIALLGSLIPQHLIITDALNGDLNFEEGGTPVQMDRILMGTDPVLMDTYAAQLMGIPAEEVQYIGMARELGVGSDDLSALNLVEINACGDVSGGVSGAAAAQKGVRAAIRSAGKIREAMACSACYGSLIHGLYRLEEEGFTLGDEIFIGQGYKGVRSEGTGIGTCTGGFGSYLPGCPPSAGEIREFLSGRNSRKA